MMIRHFLYMLLALACCLPAQSKPPITMRVHHLPTPVVIDGRPVIYYELWITATAKTPLALNKLTLINPADASVIATFGAEELSKRYVPLDKSKETRLMPGAGGLIYVEATLPVATAVSKLTHTLEVTAADTKKTSVLSGGDMTLPIRAPIVLGPPLRGGPWAAIYDASWPRGHRRVTYTVNDTIRIPGRFAIDFMKLGENDYALARGSEDSIANWHGYAADVLAVNDGIVAAVINDFPESPTLSAYQHPPAEKGSGNYVALDIGKGCYVFYEHLKPGSVTVKPGQRVKKGERIAALGFTGSTTGPHLHLHVADRNSPLGAEGLPFRWSATSSKAFTYQTQRRANGFCLWLQTTRLLKTSGRYHKLSFSLPTACNSNLFYSSAYFKAMRRMRSSSFSLVSFSRIPSTIMGNAKGVGLSGRVIMIFCLLMRFRARRKRASSS
jgi:murein DD-endopeptidase